MQQNHKNQQQNGTQKTDRACLPMDGFWHNVTNYCYDADGERMVKTSDVRTYSVIMKMGNNMINFDDIHEQEQ